jgi:hypothetical protein
MTPRFLSRSRLAQALCASAAAGVLLLAPSAAQATTTHGFGCVSNAAQNETVPANAALATVTLNGAAGAAGTNGTAGGKGSSVTFSMPVTGGQQFSVWVGCQSGAPTGAAGAAGGINGGHGGNGGGGTWLVDTGGSLSNAYAVAGGGGGGGGQWSSDTTATGGDAGSPGNTGQPDINGNHSGNGGGAGTNSAGGTGGAGGTTPPNFAAFALNGLPGSTGAGIDSGTGGQGGAATTGGGGGGAGGGGGGGGGWTGGGGGGGGASILGNGFGGSGGGGGGGSTSVSAGVTQIGSAVDNITGNGSVSITYTLMADISVSPNPEAYGNVDLGQSTSQTFTVTNPGDDPLNIGSDSLGGANPSQYTVTADTCANTTVIGGNTCSIAVQFAPSDRGQQNADLDIASNAASAQNGANAVALTGNGTLPADISVSPNPEAYGNVDLGQSTSQTFTVTNPGDDPLNIGSDSLGGANPGPYAVIADTCANTTVIGGNTCSIAVQFAPSDRGQQNADLDIASNAASAQNGANAVALTGVGLAAANISAIPSAEDYGTVADGQSSAKTVTFTNTGDKPLVITTASLTGKNADQFDILTGQDSCSAQTVAPGATCTVAVRFAPSATGYQSAALSPASSAPGSPTLVPLSGTGVAVTPTPTPTGPAAPVKLRITGISATAATIVWCKDTGCQYPLTRLRFTLNHATTVRLVLRSRARGHWTRIARTTLAGHRGINRHRIAGRWHGHLFPTGPVQILVQTPRNHHWSTAKTIRLTVRHTSQPR